MKKKGLIFIVAALLFLGAFLFFDIKPTIDVKGDLETHVEYGESYNDAGAKGYLKDRIFGLKYKVKLDNKSTVVEDELGEYQVLYSFKFGPWKASKIRTVIVEDTMPPVITLKEKKGHYTLPNAKYKEEGFKAVDVYDGDVTDQVKVKEKDGYVYYKVKDSHGNKGSAIREIFYDDPDAPEIKLTGGNHVTVVKGAKFKDPGFIAEDNVDGDLTSKVKVEGSVDTSKVGKYTLTYSVKDGYNNEAKVTRTVTVIKDEKVIYLTFDDGPYKYTEKLLKVLDKYDAKATFFVTNQYPGYQKWIKEEAKRGHAVAIHTYSHNYSKIYASEKAYFDDLNKMQDIIEAQTGKKSKLVRFPGGSSNTVSRHYCNGIMTKLAKSLEDKGYQYFDWNVSSGDAGETTSTEQVYKNVVNGCKNKEVAVVLQHDIKGFSVDAVAKILKWGKENGYKFRALDINSPTAHQSLNN